MASIHREILIDASPQLIWVAASDAGALHTKLVPGFVVDTLLEGDVRTVTFANGFAARERIVDIDDQRRRIAWSVIESPRLKHHNASLQLFDENGGTRAVWIVDLLPHDAAANVATMIEQGLAAMQRAFAADTGPRAYTP
ncbi:MAG: SRPBCC family protein [Dokdonella sp.]